MTRWLIGLCWAVFMAQNVILLGRTVQSIWVKWSILRDLKRLERLVALTKVSTQRQLTAKEQKWIRKAHRWFTKQVDRHVPPDLPR